MFCLCKYLMALHPILHVRWYLFGDIWIWTCLTFAFYFPRKLFIIFVRIIDHPLAIPQPHRRAFVQLKLCLPFHDHAIELPCDCIRQPVVGYRLVCGGLSPVAVIAMSWCWIALHFILLHHIYISILCIMTFFFSFHNQTTKLLCDWIRQLVIGFRPILEVYHL